MAPRHARRSVVQSLAVGVAVAVVSASLSAHGQPGPPSPPSPPTAAPLLAMGVTPTTSAAPLDDAARRAQAGPWTWYDWGAEALAAGERGEALRWFDGVLARWPRHPAAGASRNVLYHSRLRWQVLNKVDGLGPPGARPQPAASLVSTLIVEPTWMSTFASRLCVIAGCSRESIGGVAGTAGLLGGLGAAIWMSVSLDADHVHLITSAQLWSMWYSGAWSAWTGDTGSNKGDAAAVLVWQGAGLGAAWLLHRHVRPTRGQVGLANTLGFWAALATGLFAPRRLVVDEADNPVLGWALAASAGGMVFGAVLGSELDISYTDTFLIDLGGVGGIFVGSLIASGLQADSFNQQQALGAISVSTAVALTTWLIHHDNKTQRRARPRVGAEP
jgi:hypothetical protein